MNDHVKKSKAVLNKRVNKGIYQIIEKSQDKKRRESEKKRGRKIN